MLRPATPLTIAFLIAFVLLLLSTLSTPIIVGIPLGRNKDLSFGVFGFCNTGGSRTTCSSPKIGYARSELNQDQNDYQYAAGTRFTLSYILVVHPVAAFMVLICTVLAGAAHMRRPSHSPAFLLGLLIFTFPTLLVTLLAFLVDILLFIPHMQWGAWIVLPATIIVTACGVLTCAMRRTLVSRKARKRRIAENADMNGSNYYAMKVETQIRPLEPQFARAESPPPLQESPSANGIATYDKVATSSNYEYGRGANSMDDRTPLNARDPSLRSASSHGPRTAAMAGATPSSRDGMIDDREPISPIDGSASGPEFQQRGPAPYYRGGGPPPFNGRGRGYPYRGGPRGGPYPPRGGRGGMRGPPPGWNGNMRGGPMSRGRPPPPGYGYGYSRSPSRPRDEYGPPTNYGSRPPNDRWDQNAYAYGPVPGDGDYAYDGAPSPGSNRRPSSGDQVRDPASFGFSGRQPSPGRQSQQMMRAESPPPMPSVMPGQAVEMDARTGSPASPRDALIHEIGESAPQGDHMAGTYLPRSAWQDQSPSRTQPSAPYYQEALIPPPQPHDPRNVSASSYYEDVDPRFSADGPPLNPAQSSINTIPHAPPPDDIPPPMNPGFATYNHDNLAPDDRRDSRSPAHSDNSNFTSISQRGINPDWQPPPGSQPTPRPVRNDVLASNPDFSIPGIAAQRNRHNRNPGSGGAHRYPEA